MNLKFLSATSLFRGTTETEAEAMLKCLGAYEKQYAKGETIYHAGEYVENMGMVLSGSVIIGIADLWGNTTVLGSVEAGQLFAETYACIPGEALMVSVRASEKSTVLFLNASRLLTTCQSSCAHHARLIQNLLQISAQKNIANKPNIPEACPPPRTNFYQADESNLRITLNSTRKSGNIVE